MKTLLNLILLLWLLGTTTQAGTVKNDKDDIRISGQLSKKDVPKEIVLNYSRDYSGNTKTIIVKLVKGKFEFKVPAMDKYGYLWFDIAGVNELSTPFLAVSGDVVFVDISAKGIRFSGKDANRYQCQVEMQQVPHNNSYIEKQQRDPDNPGYTIADATKDDYQNRLMNQKKILDKYKHQLDKDSYDILWLSTASTTEYNLLVQLVYSGPHNSSVKACRENYEKYFSGPIMQPVSDLQASKAIDYVKMILLRSQLKYQLFNDTMATYRNGKAFPIGVLYREFDQKYKGLLREKLLTKLVQRNSIQGADSTDHYAKLVLNQLKDPAYYSILANEQKLYSDGAEFYNFSLQDSTGKVFSRDDFKDKIVVMEFYYKSCGPCRVVAKNLKPIIKTFEGNKDVVFVTINRDRDRKSFVESIKERVCTHETSLNLWIGEGKWLNDPLFKYYEFQGCPQLLIMGKGGKMLSGYTWRPSFQTGESTLTQQIIDIIKGGLNSDPNSKS